MGRKRKGVLVKTTSDKKGIVYNSDAIHENKYKVHVVDDKFKPTGEKLLCRFDKLKLIGYVD